MFKLTVTTPKEIIYEGLIEIVTLMTKSGEIGVLSDHVAFVDIVLPGQAHFKDEKGENHFISLSGGWAINENNNMIIYVDDSDFDYAIDITKAKANKNKALTMLEDKQLDKIKNAQAQIMLQKAINDIAMYNKKK